ncbi:hypothetical protein [Cohnella rhizosphaerae]|uniref:Flagellar protein FliT n=1 Tax=Cohnella rhizosphaerae TaxID=1457232 RepID=A0A9X4L1K6_9BACL|nr:hypothetical protein [Cohnella rhizosphaerae]MDG0811869.1 hypothetical protein [Cohnella rhizosphaerae]
MNKLDVLLVLTERLSMQIEEATPEGLENLVALRDEVIQELQGRVVTDEDRTKIQMIQVRHDLIVDRMVELRDEAARGLEQIQNSRLQKSRYEAHAPVNSFFFDKRK